jgi:hypothetical protein
MADQKSRGGQKRGNEKQPQGKKERGVGPNADKGQKTRDMGQDANRGNPGRQAGSPQGNASDEEE